MSAKLKQVINCSLEDYIAEKGIVSSLRSKSVQASEANYFKRPMRSEMDEDECDDLIFEDRKGMEVEEVKDVDDDMPPLLRVNNRLESSGTMIETEVDESGEVRPTNVSIQLDNDRECRTFVTEERKRGIKNMPSQQWRLQRENQVWKKPAGIPPLTSIKAVFDRNTDQLIASLGENAKFHNDDVRGRINQRLQQNNGRQRNYGNRNGNHNFHQHRNQRHQNRNFRNNNNRNQYGKNPNMVPSFNPNSKRLDQRSGSQMDTNQIQDLRSYITPPSSLQSQAAVGSMVPSGGIWNNQSGQLGQPQLVTFADMLNQIGRAADNQNREMFANVIRNVMRNQQQPTPANSMAPAMMTPDAVSMMNPTELMPFAAQTLLNHISTVQQNFGPKYDMKVQKEIHALQGKSLLYRANGVVSMDGPGVGNDRVMPTTTDLSMNMRFS